MKNITYLSQITQLSKSCNIHQKINAKETVLEKSQNFGNFAKYVQTYYYDLHWFFNTNYTLTKSERRDEYEENNPKQYTYYTDGTLFEGY